MGIAVFKLINLKANDMKTTLIILIVILSPLWIWIAIPVFIMFWLSIKFYDIVLDRKSFNVRGWINY